MALTAYSGTDGAFCSEDLETKRRHFKKKKTRSKEKCLKARTGINETYILQLKLAG